MRSRFTSALAVSLGLFAIAGAILVDRGATPATAAGGSPAANKVVVAGSKLDLLEASVLGSIVEKTILSANVKTSSTDVLFYLTAECALFTKVATQGGETDTATAQAQVKMYIKIDGKYLGIDGVLRNEDISTADPIHSREGDVVFCDREHQQTTSFVDDGDDNDNDEYLEQHLRTRTANAFNWVALDLTPGTHFVEVVAVLDASVTQGNKATADATATVGRRTLVVLPQRLANGSRVEGTELPR